MTSANPHGANQTLHLNSADYQEFGELSELFRTLDAAADCVVSALRLNPKTGKPRVGEMHFSNPFDVELLASSAAAVMVLVAFMERLLVMPAEARRKRSYSDVVASLHQALEAASRDAGNLELPASARTASAKEVGRLLSVLKEIDHRRQPPIQQLGPEPPSL